MVFVGQSSPKGILFTRARPNNLIVVMSTSVVGGMLLANLKRLSLDLGACMDQCWYASFAQRAHFSPDADGY